MIKVRYGHLETGRSHLLEHIQIINSILEMMLFISYLHIPSKDSRIDLYYFERLF
jgi:hypothetical protein